MTDRVEYLYHTHLGNPIPYKRPRFNSERGFTHNDPDYHNYKKELVSSMQPCPKLNFNLPSNKNARNKYFDENCYRLTVIAYRGTRHKCDVDNLIKTAQDAIEEAGLIYNDHQIKHTEGYLLYDKQNPRLTLIMKRLSIEEVRQSALAAEEMAAQYERELDEQESE